MTGELVGPPANFRAIVRRERARIRDVDIEELLASVDPAPLPAPPEVRQVLTPEQEMRFAYWESLTMDQVTGVEPRPTFEEWLSSLTVPDVS